LILSYVLHGHIPRYVRHHPDHLIHSKISARHDLLDLSPDLYEHLTSSLRYSNQALPINTLLDTLIRPNADTEVGQPSCVEWKRECSATCAKVSHVVLGDTNAAGGQWADNPIRTSEAIGALSYAEMLSLPGYSYADHYARIHKHPLPEFQRPSRDEVADYYAAYPAATGIEDAVHTSVKVENISRRGDGFIVQPQNIRCKHLVLASGVFSVPVPPPRSLDALATMDSPQDPLLVIGSGFSAADVIITASPRRKILHVYHWDPEDRPSPLKGCHYQAYPEYAAIYRQMKMAATSSPKGTKRTAGAPLKKKNRPALGERDWASTYQGFPNATVLSCTLDEHGVASVRIQLASGETTTCKAGGLAYVVGRRGTLDYLDTRLRAEVFGPGTAGVAAEADSGTGDRSLVSGRTLRPKADVDLEVAPSVFIIGSLAGDSLVRHAFGGCLYAAGKIIHSDKYSDHPEGTKAVKSIEQKTPPSPRTPQARTPNGGSGTGSPVVRSNGSTHQDLHLDRRKLARALDGCQWRLEA
jgi:hypothetical protein